MEVDNQLVAYIQSENSEPFIDLVKISKKGTSFYYEGVWWMREPVLRSGYCTNEKGERLKINPLSHSYNLYENYDGVIKIKESAQVRYKSWVKREIKAVDLYI